MHPCLAALLSALSDAREVVLTPEPARVLALVAALNVENLFSAVTLHAEHDMPAVSADIRCDGKARWIHEHHRVRLSINFKHQVHDAAVGLIDRPYVPR